VAIDVPTATVLPFVQCRRRSVPSYGDGISTVAFAVSISAIG
jgi:hypothetical protein